MNKAVVVSIVLAILLIISVAQAVQINTLKGDLKSGELSVRAAPTGAVVAPVAPVAPAAVANQPGCGL